MGCCETRDQSDPKFNDNKEKYVNKLKLEDKVTQTTNEEQRLETKTLNSSKSEKSSGSNYKYVKYIENCKKNKQYDQLVKLVTDPTEINKPKIYIHWAEKPKTIGSLALVYLCQILPDENEDLMPLVLKITPVLIEFLKSGSGDLRDNSLMLLYYYLDYATDEAVKLLITQGIYSALLRYIMCSKEELRHLTAGICYKIYRNRPYAKKLFIEKKGGKQLVQQISWSSENDKILNILLEYLIELLQDKDDKVMQEYINRLNEDSALEIIRDITNTDKSAETLENIDYLIGLLSSE